MPTGADCSPDLSIIQAVSQRYHRTRGRKELHPGIERGHAHKADCGALGRKSEHGKEEFLRICEVVRADIIKKERKDLNQLVGAPKTAPGFFLTIYSCMILEEYLL